MRKNIYWPAGASGRVSRAARAAIERSRGFPWMSPEARERAAAAYDAAYGAASAARKVADTPDARRALGQRQVCELAVEAARDWKALSPHAAPYLQAMATMRTVRDKFGADEGHMVVAYFLSNAKAWRGPVARRVKAELGAMLKAEGL